MPGFLLLVPLLVAHLGLLILLILPLLPLIALLRLLLLPIRLPP